MYRDDLRRQPTRIERLQALSDNYRSCGVDHQFELVPGAGHQRAPLQAAAARGVVGIVDFDMAWNAEAWRRRTDARFDTTRIRFGIYPPQLDRALAEGMRTGDALDERGFVRVGSLKVITDGSLGTRTAACSHAYPGDPHNHGILTVSPDALVELMTRATGEEYEYIDETIAEARASRAHYGAPDWQVEAWISTYTAIRDGELDLVSGHVQEVLGRAPLGLEEAVADPL